MNDIIPSGHVKCRRCSQIKEADQRDPHLCVDCAKAERNRYHHIRMHQKDWMEVAEDSDIPVWLQQPGETQHEYTIWTIFRDAYPGRKLTYREVAEQAGTSKDVVRKVAQRWTFQARMQAWMAECDRITMIQRRDEILNMNREHIDMAQRLRDKLSKAIDLVDPAALKPSDLASLMRLSSDLERKARVDEIAQDEMRLDVVRGVEDNPDLKKSPTKTEDLSEVVKILMSAGALGDITHIGVRKTETTEVLVGDASGNAATLTSE